MTSHGRPDRWRARREGIVPAPSVGVTYAWIRCGTTLMRYQVEGGGRILESRCYSLREARAVARGWSGRGVGGVQIARYDEATSYYEVVEVIS